jgi:hypothetical protein
MTTLAQLTSTPSLVPPLTPPPMTRLRANVARRNSDRSYVVRRALDPQTRRDAYALRHASYLASGYIDARRNGLFSDRYDLLPSSHTIAVYQDERAVAAVRVCFLSSGNLDTAPAGTTFPDEVGNLLAALPRRRGKPQAAEITRLVRSPSAENNQGLVFLLLRVAGYLALQEDVPLLMSCVRQNHVPFYRRIGCNTASGLRPYPGLKCAMQLLACPRENYDEACATFPIMDPFAGPADAFDGFMAGSSVVMPLIPGS